MPVVKQTLRQEKLACSGTVEFGEMMLNYSFVLDPTSLEGVQFRNICNLADITLSKNNVALFLTPQERLFFCQLLLPFAIRTRVETLRAQDADGLVERELHFPFYPYKELQEMLNQDKFGCRV